jgi:hypothetical protein
MIDLDTIHNKRNLCAFFWYAHFVQLCALLLFYVFTYLLIILSLPSLVSLYFYLFPLLDLDRMTA